LIVDYHMHLRDSAERIVYGENAVEAFVETAAARGVDEIGFTEHVYYFRQTRELWQLPYQTERCVYDLDEYCEEVLDAKRRGLPVKLGLEVDHVGEDQARLSEILAPYPFDFLLGSVHWIDGLAVDQEPGLWVQASVEEVWQRYVDALGELATSGAVDVLSHPDLAKIFSRRPADPTPFHDAIATAAAEGGVCLEISTAGLHKPVGELYPDPEILDLGRAYGVPITLASDAHVPQNVGRDFDRSLELAQDAGYETVSVFDRRTRREEPLG
jgi:histidinol-phosphatase (PHP family)